MGKKKLLYMLPLFLTMMAGCKREDFNTPADTNSNPPGLVSNVSVTNQSGKAVLTYTLPSDKDLLYVKAAYETSPGVATQVIASRYTNTLTVDGFGDTLQHTIKLYAVNSSEKASSSVD